MKGHIMQPLAPATMKSVRKKQLRLSQAKLGQILGYTGRQIANIENGNSPMPLWMSLALAWLVINGCTNPFTDVSI